MVDLQRPHTALRDIYIVNYQRPLWTLSHQGVRPFHGPEFMNIKNFVEKDRFSR